MLTPPQPPPTRPKAVVFDLGNVLLDFDYLLAIRRILPRCRVGLGTLSAVLNGSTLLIEYESGRINTAEFVRQVRDSTGFEGDSEEFASLFGDIFREVHEMTALVPRLRQAGIPCYLFSNTNELATRHIAAQYPFYAGFDGHVLSYEHGAVKPDPALYAVVERLSGLAGADLLYFDDRPENVRTALDRGWQGIVHRRPDESIQLLRTAGVPVE